MAAAFTYAYPPNASAGASAVVVQRGVTMPEQERVEKIAAIIGDTALEKFLALERNRGDYWEVGKMASLLRRKGVPTTGTQRHELLKILAEVHERYAMPAPPDLDKKSLEYLEHTLTQLDEYDRHTMELIPSVLTPTQGVYVFNAYQRMADERADSLEQQKKQRAANPSERSWFYPGRWND
jgi:hypothetical protein